jgi:rubredoxin
MPETTTATPQRAGPTLMCTICGWVYHERRGLPRAGIAAGTQWADLPRRFACAECGAEADRFQTLQLGE